MVGLCRGVGEDVGVYAFGERELKRGTGVMYPVALLLVEGTEGVEGGSGERCFVVYDDDACGDGGGGE